jgi:hypothetical protein
MNIDIIQKEDLNIGVLASGSFINTIDDAVDLLGNSDYLGARKVIIRENQVCNDFFDLKTGVAGEILQKFSNYRIQLAIVGDFSKYTSKSLRDFIYESNKSGLIFFASSEDEAFDFLTK